MREFIYEITQKHNGITVIEFLKNEHNYSAAIIRFLKQKQGRLLLNGNHIRVVDLLHEGDILKVTLDDKSIIKPNYNLDVEVVFEDDDLIIFNKPPNMPVHPCKSYGMDTLANFFTAYYEQKGQILSFRPINRLDKDTSGLCVVAKNALSASILSGKVKKYYTAILDGDFPNNEGIIDLPIGRPDINSIKRAVMQDGKPSKTKFSVVARTKKTTAVWVDLITGRTHQIRVHFSHLGFPLLGDELYGGNVSVLKRQALHCCKMEFIHPTTKELMKFEIDLPLDLKKFL